MLSAKLCMRVPKTQVNIIFLEFSSLCHKSKQELQTRQICLGQWKTYYFIHQRNIDWVYYRAVGADLLGEYMGVNRAEVPASWNLYISCNKLHTSVKYVIH